MWCLYVHAMLMCVLVAKLCPILYNPMDSSLPASSVHGVSQARILQCIAFLQGIFLIQGSNLCLLHFQWIFTTEPPVYARILMHICLYIESVHFPIYFSNVNQNMELIIYYLFSRLTILEKALTYLPMSIDFWYFYEIIQSNRNRIVGFE